ncbi:MAG: hypothetical protein R3D67_09390 [Hyphomicrobiaceae bacterium]
MRPPPEGRISAQLAFAFDSFLDDDAGKVLVDVDDHLFDGFHTLACRLVGLGYDLGTGDGQLEAFAGACSRSGCRAALAAAGDLEAVLSAFSLTRMATLRSISFIRRSRMTRLLHLVAF